MTALERRVRTVLPLFIFYTLPDIANAHFNNFYTHFILILLFGTITKFKLCFNYKTETLPQFIPFIYK
jgi:hypothetical protein